MTRRGAPSLVPLLLASCAGAAGLCAELSWARMLGIEVGSALAALSVVVCAVTLGLALGAERLGRAADRARRPLRLFALCQAGAALLSLVSALSPSWGGFARPIVSVLGMEPEGPLFLTTIALTYGIYAGAASFLMGGTVPLLLREVDPHEPIGRRAGRLAAFSAAGGAAGVLLCGFVLLPLAGLRSSLLAAAALSLGASVVAAGRAATAPGEARGAPSPAKTGRANGPAGGSPARPPARKLPVLAALAASGFAVTALEVAWTRVASCSFGSSAQAASLVLASAIAGLALGAAAGARWAPGIGPTGALTLLLAGGAVSLVITDPILGRLPVVAAWLDSRLAHGPEAPLPALGDQAIRFAIFLALAGLPSALLGACFPAGCRALQAGSSAPDRSEAHDTGLASAACAVGNTLGAPIAFFALLPAAGSRGVVIASAAALAICSLLAGGALPGFAAGRVAGRGPGALALLAVVAGGILLSWDPGLMSSGPFLYGPLYAAAVGPGGEQTMADALQARGDLIFARDGADALVTVRRSREGLLSMQVNGKTDASTGGDLKTQALTAHLPLLLSEAAGGAPGRVLVIGLGSGITAAAALAHPVDTVEVLEISPGVAEASRLFDEANRRALDDPRLTLRVRDARAHLLFARRRPDDPGGDALYDVIASQPSNPWVAGQAILFTREFFELARTRLATGGIMCQWVQGQGLDSDDFRSIVATFAGAFPHVSLWEESTAGGDYLLVGSLSPMAIDAGRLVSAMGRPEVSADLERIEISSPADLLTHYVAGAAQVARLAQGAPAQTEDRLALEFTAPAALRRETLGGILEVLEPIRTDPGTLAGIGGPLARDLSRRARRARKEREWAAGLGLLEAQRTGTDPDLIKAASYLRAGMKAHALETLRGVALRRPSERVPHLMRAHLLMSIGGAAGAGAVDESIRELRSAVALQPEEPRARLFLSRALYSAGRLEEAIAQNALIRPPLPAEASSDRCAMLLAGGDLASAEAACLDALALDSGLAEAHANLGVVRARRGRNDAAEASYRRAIELDPEMADARYNLAALMARQSRAAEGLEALAPLILEPEGPADAATWRLAARLALAAGDRRAARAHLDASLAVEPASEEAREIERMLGGGK